MSSAELIILVSTTVLLIFVAAYLFWSRPWGYSRASRVSRGTCELCGGPEITIFDPIFNFDKVCGECCLLEDHCSREEERCDDCIKKHAIKIEALLNEAQQLDEDGAYGCKIKEAMANVSSFRQLVNDGDYGQAGQQIRKIRKALMAHA